MAGRNRRRLKPGFKLAGMLCLYCVVMSLVVLGINAGYQSLHRSNYFAIDQLVFEGTSVRTEPTMRQVFADVRGQNLLAIDLNEYREKALGNQWVQEIDIHRELPNRLLIRLTERQPVGLCRYEGKTYLYDRDGCIIDSLQSGKMVVSAPILRGIRRESLKEDLLFGFQFLSELKAENRGFWTEMEEINIQDRENIVAYTHLVDAPLYLGRQPVPGNLSRFMSVVPYINRNYPDLEYVELAVPKQVVIRPRGGGF